MHAGKSTKTSISRAVGPSTVEFIIYEMESESPENHVLTIDELHVHQSS